MDKRQFRLLVAIAIMALAFSSGPAIAQWGYTEASPLLFNFNDNSGITFTNPDNTLMYPNSNWPYMSGSSSPNTKFCDGEGRPTPTGDREMRHQFTGSALRLQRSHSSGFPHLFFSQVRCHEGIVNAEFTNQFSFAGLDVDNKGLVVEVKSKSIGSPDSHPPSYNWGGNTLRGGVWLNLRSKNLGFQAVWHTNSATTQDDDAVGIFTPGWGLVARELHPLGGTPTSAPENAYKITVRRSPVIPGTNTARVLLNVYVKKNNESEYTRVIENVNALLSAATYAQDFVSIGSIDKSANGSYGEEYDWLKLYEGEAVVDTDNPTAPGNLTLQALSPTLVIASWDASTDPTTEVVGYRVYRDGGYIGFANGNQTTYSDPTAPPDSTLTYSVRAVDLVGNLSDESSAIVSTVEAYTGSELTFLFNNPAAIYTATSTPNHFYTETEETSMFWFGQKAPAPASGDGYVGWWLDDHTNKLKWEFTGDGALICQSVGPVLAGRHQARLATNHLDTFMKWVYDDSDPDSPPYIRGMKVTAEIDIVGDQNGWCAQWPAGGDPLFPAVPPCGPDDPDFFHQGSDWGSGWYNARSGVMISVAANQQLDEPGHGGKGATGSGTSMWVQLYAGNVHDRSDDRVSLAYVSTGDVGPDAEFRFLDGLGLGLVPECGTAGGNGFPRDGIIQGTTNRVLLEVGVCKAPAPEGDPNPDNWEYWDIWITRPDGIRIHIDPMTAQLTSLRSGYGWVFGKDGHTLYGARHAYAGFPNHIQLGTWENAPVIFGQKYNWLEIRNDWDGDPDPGRSVHKLSDLRDMPEGTRVSFGKTGGEKIVTILSQAEDFFAGPRFFYVQEEDRSAGIRIVHNYSDLYPNLGQKVSVLGFLQRDAHGNFYVDVTEGTCDFSDGSEIEPVGLTNLAIGGSDVTGGVGLHNVGILATAWGKVTDVGDDYSGNVWFVLDDGSGTPVKCHDYIYDGVISFPLVGQYWTVTGPIASEKVGDDYQRAIVVRSAEEVN